MQLPDEQVQALLEEISRLGREHARAKALVTSLREMRKITVATLMKVGEAHGINSERKQERFAYAHPQYRELVDKLAKAEEEAITAEVEHGNAEREWESWRTICANERAIR